MTNDQDSLSVKLRNHQLQKKESKIQLKLNKSIVQGFEQVKETFDKVDSEHLKNMFDESIEKLRVTDLHEAIKNAYNNEKQKIIDIYYEPTKMIKWRDTCVKAFQGISQKIDNLQNQIQVYHQQSQQLEQFYEELPQIQSILDKIKVTLSLDDSPQQLQSLQLLNTELQNVLLHSIQITTVFIKEYNPLLEAKSPFKNIINKLSVNCDKANSDLRTLEKPKTFLDSYQQILKEMNRRNIYNHFMRNQSQNSGTVGEINKVIEKEVILRKEFMLKYGSIIPSESFPNLSFKPQKIKIALNEDELLLPQVYDWVPIDAIKTPQDYFFIIDNFDNLVDSIPEKMVPQKSEKQNQSPSSNLSDANSSGKQDQLTQQDSKNSQEYINLQKKYKVMKSKLKDKNSKLKKSITNQTKINMSLQEHIKDLSEQYKLDVSKITNPNSGKSDAIDQSEKENLNNNISVELSKLYNLVSRICQTNYSMAQDLKQQICLGKSSQVIASHLQNIKQLEQQNEKLVAENSSYKSKINKLVTELQSIQQQSPRITKKDHMNYINKIHEFNKAEQQKILKENADLRENIKTYIEKLNVQKNYVKDLEDQFHNMKEQKIDALNQLQYKQIEIERLKEDQNAKLKQLRQNLEDKIYHLQQDINEKDAQIESFNNIAQDYQHKIASIQKEFDEQMKSFQKKISERKQECDNMKAQMEKQQKDYAEKEREFNRVIKDSQTFEKENYEIKLKQETLVKQLDQVKCQMQNAIIAKDNFQKQLDSKIDEVKQLQNKDAKNEEQLYQLSQENNALSAKLISINTKVQELDKTFSQKLEITKTQYKADIQSLKEQLQKQENEMMVIQQENYELLQQISGQEQVKTKALPLNQLDQEIQTAVTDVIDNQSQFEELKLQNQELVLNLQCQQDYFQSIQHDLKLDFDKQIQKLVKSMISYDKLELGCNLVFIPFQPGVFVCLTNYLDQVQQIVLIDEQNSVQSFNQTNKTTANISKKVCEWRYLLDVESLDKKTSQILNNFEMIVIGQLVEKYKGEFDADQLNNQEEDEELDLDQEPQTIEVEYCRIKVTKLIAISELQLTTYNYME